MELHLPSSWYEAAELVACVGSAWLHSGIGSVGGL